MNYTSFGNYQELTAKQKKTCTMLNEKMSIKDIMAKEGIKEQAVRVRILAIGKKLIAPTALTDYASEIRPYMTKRMAAISASNEFGFTIPTSILVFTTGIDFPTQETAQKNLINRVVNEHALSETENIVTFLSAYVLTLRAFSIPMPSGNALCDAFLTYRGVSE